MTKLKCWKKVNSFIWAKKDESEALMMTQKGFEKKYTYSKSIKNKEDGHYIVKNHIFPYSTKVRAEKLANKYMKEHDKC